MTIDPIVIALAVSGVGAMGIAAVVLTRRASPAVRAARSLARAEGLHARERADLERLARQAGLRSCGSLILSRGAFDRALRHAPRAGQPQWLRLRARLHGDETEQASSSPDPSELPPGRGAVADVG